MPMATMSVPSKNPEQVKAYILELMKVRPYTPSELGEFFSMTRENMQRVYLKKLLEDGKIKHVEGTNAYTLSNSKHSADDVQKNRDINTLDQFLECDTIKRWMENNTSKERDRYIKAFAKVCMGKWVKDFKIDPDLWIHPDTTKECIQKLKAHYSRQKLPNHCIKILRWFVQYGLGKTMTEAEGVNLGISGAKDKPQYNTLHMKAEQYADAKRLTNEESRTLFIKFGFRYWTFCRPSSMYLVETADLEFYDRTVEYVEIEGEKVSDKNFIKYLKSIGQTKDIKKYTHRACRIPNGMLEHKTDIRYIKYIYDKEIVNALEAYAKERKKQGFKYLFWDKNDTKFTFANYDKIVRHAVKKDNNAFKIIFMQIGFKEGDFGLDNRANYAIRHFGAQRWLELTNFNYGFVSDIGWEDTNTLRSWYGKRPAHLLEKQAEEIII